MKHKASHKIACVFTESNFYMTIQAHAALAGNVSRKARQTVAGSFLGQGNRPASRRHSGIKGPLGSNGSAVPFLFLRSL
jgi:hypothetical protein